jgi:hypothetical protein
LTGQHGSIDYPGDLPRRRQQAEANARRALLPELSTATVNVHQVSLRNVRREDGNASRIFGVCAEPKASGKCRARLRSSGAGAHTIRDLIRELEKGAIALSIEIHGALLRD